MVGRYFKRKSDGNRCRVDGLIPKLDAHGVRAGHTVLFTFDGATYQDSMDAPDFENTFTSEPTGSELANEILKGIKLRLGSPTGQHDEDGWIIRLDLPKSPQLRPSSLRMMTLGTPRLHEFNHRLRSGEVCGELYKAFPKELVRRWNGE